MELHPAVSYWNNSQGLKFFSKSYENVTQSKLDPNKQNCTCRTKCLEGKCQQYIIFVGGTRGYIKKEEIEKYFYRYGQVVNVEVVKKGYNCKGGFCFVRFEDKSCVEECISLRYHIICRTRVEAKSFSRQKAHKRKQETAKSLYQRMNELLSLNKSADLFQKYGTYLFMKDQW